MVKNGSQFNKIPKINAKPYNENRFLEGLERGLDVLGSSGGGSLLTAPFRAAKVLKNTAKGIYNGIVAPQKMEARKKLALQNQQNAKQLAFKKKQDALKLKEATKNEKLRQKELVKNEQFKQKLNTRLAGDNSNRNPVAKFGFGELAPTPQVNVGANINKFNRQQQINKAKGTGLPLASPEARQNVARQQQLRQSGLNKLQNKPRNPNLGFNSPNTLQKPQPLNVGAKMGQYKTKQNSAISKGLSNPVNKPNAEDKIKNIMGVN